MLNLDLLILKFSNKVWDAPFHITPRIDFSQIVVNFCRYWMTRIFEIAGFCHDPTMEIIHLWNTQATLLPQHIISPLFNIHHLLLMNICLTQVRLSLYLSSPSLASRRIIHIHYKNSNFSRVYQITYFQTCNYLHLHCHKTLSFLYPQEQYSHGLPIKGINNNINLIWVNREYPYHNF